MCQLCRITPTATSARWPKPVESSIADLNFLVTYAHDQHEAWQKSQQNQDGTNNATVTDPLAALLETLRTLSTALTPFERERMAWWKGKAALVKKLNLDVGADGQAKLTELHKINNCARERVEVMEARLGGFVKWTCGVEGGVEALMGEEGEWEE